MGDVNQTEELVTDPDLLIDMRNVSFIRGGHTLVGPVDWQVELDERWVCLLYTSPSPRDS